MLVSRKSQLSIAFILMFVIAAFMRVDFSEPPSSATESLTDLVTFLKPLDSNSLSRIYQAEDWLRKHTVIVRHPVVMQDIQVIAWKDPTLDPGDPMLLAGYIITDTLWAAKAIKPFDKNRSDQMDSGIRQLGWQSNGLHDVLFHPVSRMLHRSADEDIVHGYSLGRFHIDGGRQVDLRVFRQKYDAEYEVGHPHLFAEHAVYQAFFDFWQGRKAQARRRILGIVLDDRNTGDNDQIFWDQKAKILVDYVNREEWSQFQARKIKTCRHYSFKLGVLLYAIKMMGLESDVGPALIGMKSRLWSAQIDDGGIAHFIDVLHDGELQLGRRDSTGESTAIVILSETVQPANIKPASPH